jgi:CheY-like chemotaxis protein
MKKTPVLDKKRILIVDDEPGMILLAKIALENSGCNITTALNGEECLRILKEGGRPNLILLDILMPKISGFDVCNKIRSKPKFDNIRIIYHTALPEHEIKAQTKKTMADGYIIKGVSLDDLRQKISEILSRPARNS